jgi:hypothetical protein
MEADVFLALVGKSLDRLMIGAARELVRWMDDEYALKDRRAKAQQGKVGVEER